MHARARPPARAACLLNPPPARSSAGNPRAHAWAPKRLCAPRAGGDLPVAQLYETAERADVGGTVRTHADRGVVAVEAEPGAGELFIHGGAGSERERGQVPGVDFVRPRRLGVGVDEP